MAARCGRTAPDCSETIVDTSLHAELPSGWREHLGEALGDTLAN